MFHIGLPACTLLFEVCLPGELQVGAMLHFPADGEAFGLVLVALVYLLHSTPLFAWRCQPDDIRHLLIDESK